MGKKFFKTVISSQYLQKLSHKNENKQKVQNSEVCTAKHCSNHVGLILG